MVFQMMSSVWKAPSTKMCCRSSIVRDSAMPNSTTVARRDMRALDGFSSAVSVMPIGSNINMFRHISSRAFQSKLLNGAMPLDKPVRSISRRHSRPPYITRTSHMAKTTLLTSRQLSALAADTDLPMKAHTKGTSTMPAISSQFGSVCIKFITNK